MIQFQDLQVGLVGGQGFKVLSLQGFRLFTQSEPW